MTVERNITSDLGKIKFNGKSCVRSFIQKVDEFVVSRGIDYEKILSFDFEIFLDDALHWFRCFKSSVTTWAELVPLLKADFSPFDFNYRFLAEIRYGKRTRLFQFTYP